MLNKMRPPSILLAAAVTALAVAGCTDGPDTGSETTSPAPTVSTPSEEETQAVADATAALHRFYEVRDQCQSDPQNADSSCFDSVAVDQELTEFRTSLDNLQRARERIEGTSEVLSVDVVWVELDSPTPQVRLAVCVDQRTMRPVDASGEPLLSPEDLPNAPQRVVWQLINYDYPAADQWKVSFAPAGEDESC